MLNYICAGGLGGLQFRLEFALGYVNPAGHAERLGDVGHDVGLRARAAASRYWTGSALTHGPAGACLAAAHACDLGIILCRSAVL
jgi:hypothetical protein